MRISDWSSDVCSSDLTMQHADAYGLKASNVGFDLEKVVKRSRGVSGQLNKGVGHLLKKNKVTVFDGEGKLNGPGKLSVAKDGKKLADLTAPHIILATGARPRALPGIEPELGRASCRERVCQ